MMKYLFARSVRALNMTTERTLRYGQGTYERGNGIFVAKDAVKPYCCTRQCICVLSSQRKKPRENQRFSNLSSPHAVTLIRER